MSYADDRLKEVVSNALEECREDPRRGRPEFDALVRKVTKIINRDHPGMFRAMVRRAVELAVPQNSTPEEA